MRSSAGSARGCRGFMSPDGRYKPFACTILALVVILLYLNTLSGGFVWDDNLFTTNQVYWEFDFKKIFFSLANGLEYQPVRDLSYLFDIFVWRGSPFGFHLTNLLLFVAIVILAYNTAENLYTPLKEPEDIRPQWFVPLFAALLFAVHPLRTEVVAWATQRNTLLATLFFMLSCNFFLRYLEKGGKKAITLSLGSFFLAILSKATVVILPLLLLFFLFLRRGEEWRRKEFWLPLAPFIALSAAGVLLHVTIARKTEVISSAYYGTLQERLATALQIPLFYLKKSLFPVDISAFYAENFSLSLGSPRVLLSALLLAVMTIIAWMLRRRYPEILLGGGWFVITLLPVSN